jgi:16S rRNA processing protein RimM
MPGPDLLEVGRITRAHGLRGEVIVDLSTDRLERLAEGTVLRTPRGDLTVSRAASHGTKFVVAFSEIVNRTEAERWRGVTLSAERLDLEGVTWVDELFGATLETADGVVRGRVVSVEANPASDLMVLDSGALVPVRFVTSVVPRERVVVEAPEGLFE